MSVEEASTEIELIEGWLIVMTLYIDKIKRKLLHPVDIHKI